MLYILYHSQIKSLSGGVYVGLTGNPELSEEVPKELAALSESLNTL
jgi:hypothetical protein